MVYIVCFCLNQYCEKVVSYETDFQFSLCELSFREGLSSIGLSRIYSGISLKALKDTRLFGCANIVIGAHCTGWCYQILCQ